MKKIFFLFLLFTFCHSVGIMAQTPDTSVMTAANALYQFKSEKNGVPISPVAPKAIHQKADNKLIYFKNLLQGQIDNVNSVMPLKINASDAASTYATITNLDAKASNTRADSIIAALAAKLNSTTAASTYATITNLDAKASNTRADSIIAALAAKLNTSTAASTYATITNLDAKASNTRADSIIAALAAKLNTSTAASTYALKTDVGVGANSIYYVDRRWTGTRGGASWTAQNNAAIRGNISYAFPDLWAARNKAVIDLKAGTISKAVIYVFGGNSFSFSNVVDSSNDYESATFEAKRYDTYNSDTTSTNTVSLLYNNLDYYFEQNTTLVHNGQSSITVPFADGTTSVSSSVRGFLTYKANYGQGQGKNTQSIIVRGVNSKILIDLYKWDSKAGWNENYVKSKEFTFNAEVVYRVTGAFLITGGSNGSNVKVNVGSFFQGKYAGTDYMVDDCWAIFIIGSVSSILKNSSIAIDVKQASVEESCDGLFYMQSLDTSNVKINFGTLLQASRSNHTATPAYIINAQGGTWNSSNVTMDIGIHNGDMGLSQIQCTINKSQVAIDCGVCNVNNSAQPTKAAFKMWNSADSLSSVVVTGNYRSISNPIVEIASASNKMVLDGTYRTTSSNAAIVLSTNAPLTLLKGQVYSSGTNSISATSASSYITILPSATANKVVSSNVVTQGATLSVNSLFKL